MLVKRLVQSRFCLDTADKAQVMFYFTEIKWNHENIAHLEVCKCQDFTHLKGFYNLDKTLDSEFCCLKCFVSKSFQEQSTILNLFGFFVILCSLNGL